MGFAVGEGDGAPVGFRVGAGEAATAAVTVTATWPEQAVA